MPAMTSQEGPPRGLRPAGPLRGALRAPGSKSIAQRALVCAAIAEGTTRLAGLPDGEDVRAALALVAACAAPSEPASGGAIDRTGAPPGAGRGWSPPVELDLGQSGTLARLALATLALCAPEGTRVSLAARGSLLRRSTPALLTCLRSAGVEVSSEAWPVELVSHPPPTVLLLEHPCSSQEVSALLIALAAWPVEHVLEVRGAIPSRPYVDLTRRVVTDFGATVGTSRTEAGEAFSVHGPLRAPRGRLEIEPDASLAAVALAAGCITGGEVTALGLSGSSAQGDVRVVEHLAAFGCRAEFTTEGIHALGEPQHGAELDLEGEPDLAPVLAIVAAASGAWSELRGLSTLPGKESSRIEVLARGLEQAGWQAVARADSLRIGPRRSGGDGLAVLDPQDDHRMAFAFALLGLLRAGLAVSRPACVGKSWPSFWDDLGRIGARAFSP